MLAVLKCGATFLPLDPDLPSNFVGNILTEARVRLVLTTRNLSIEIAQIQEQSNSKLHSKLLFADEIIRNDTSSTEGTVSYYVLICSSFFFIQ